MRTQRRRLGRRGCQQIAPAAAGHAGAAEVERLVGPGRRRRTAGLVFVGGKAEPAIKARRDHQDRAAVVMADEGDDMSGELSRDRDRSIGARFEQRRMAAAPVEQPLDGPQLEPREVAACQPAGDLRELLVAIGLGQRRQFADHRQAFVEVDRTTMSGSTSESSRIRAPW